MQDLIKKLKFKPEAIVINAPDNLINDFINNGFATSFNQQQKSTNTLIFINNHKEFIDFLNHQIANTEYDSLLWFAYPKGSSGIKTDINRDILKDIAIEFRITTVTAISVNDTWSALRFRPVDRVGK